VATVRDPSQVGPRRQTSPRAHTSQRERRRRQATRPHFHARKASPEGIESLVRLNAIAPDRWLLKGGFALDLRLAGRARATKDIDLDWRDVDDELLDTLLDAAEHDAGDFFVFSIERSGALADRIAGGQRFRVSASLAGRAFETFPLDVALRAEPMLAADTLTTPDLLAFAGLGPVRVPALPLERQAAEKLHAYTRIYEGERPSSRTKDLVDIVLIAELAALDAAKLWSAIGTTFTMRGTTRYLRQSRRPSGTGPRPSTSSPSRSAYPPISRRLTPSLQPCWTRSSMERHAMAHGTSKASDGREPGAGDDDSVETFAAQAADPALGDRVRPRRLGWGLDDVDLGCLEHGVKGVGELGVAVTNEKTELLGAVAEVHQEVPGLLSDPEPGRAGGDPATCTRRVPCSMKIRV